MLIDFGDSYQLECIVDDGEPSIKLVGEYFTINYSSSRNEEKSYLDKGFLAYRYLNFNSRVVIEDYYLFNKEDKSEALISFSLFTNEVLYIYFDLITGEVGYQLE